MDVDGADANDADALLAAIKACQDAAVALLIERGCFVNFVCGGGGQRPLTEAFFAHDVAIGGGEDALARRIKIVKMLLAAGAQTEYEMDYYGGQHHAVLEYIFATVENQRHPGYDEGTAVLEALLAAGARADLYHLYHGTPLRAACGGWLVDVVKVLVKHSEETPGGSAILAAVDEYGQTALMTVVRDGPGSASTCCWRRQECPWMPWTTKVTPLCTCASPGTKVTWPRSS